MFTAGIILNMNMQDVDQHQQEQYKPALENVKASTTR
jgi:hypothetical protein